MLWHYLGNRIRVLWSCGVPPLAALETAGLTKGLFASKIEKLPGAGK
jgi:hypothetical protein